MTGEEFRVVGVEAAFGRRFVNENPTSLSEAEKMVEHFRSEGDRNVRVEAREVGPWKRVETEREEER